ncbi:MAG: hypothetical protein ACE10K_03310 [Rhodothermales bacterium]
MAIDKNNGFEQYNATAKLNILTNPRSALFLKSNINYENSNATYTGLTEYSFENDPRFNPKEDDLFKVFRTSFEAIYDRQPGTRSSILTRAYLTYFDRRWWRENDIFIRAADLDQYLRSALLESCPHPHRPTTTTTRSKNDFQNRPSH